MNRTTLFSAVLTTILATGCASSPASSDQDPAGGGENAAGALTGSSGTVAFHGKLKLKEGQDDDFLPIYFSSLEIAEDGTFKGEQSAQVDGGDGNLETGVRTIPSGKTKWTASSHRDQGTVAFSYVIAGEKETLTYLYKVDGNTVSLMLRGAVTMAVGRKASTELLKKTWSEILQKVGEGNVAQMKIQ